MAILWVAVEEIFVAFVTVLDVFLSLRGFIVDVFAIFLYSELMHLFMSCGFVSLLYFYMISFFMYLLAYFISEIKIKNIIKNKYFPQKVRTN